MAISVYIAGATADLERAEAMRRVLLTIDGVTVTSTWTDVVRARGHGNPREASADARRGWSQTDLAQVAQAKVLLFLVPLPEQPTRGAWVELGYAYAMNKIIVSCGDTRQSIFAALGVEFALDWAAVEYIKILNSWAD